MSLPPAIPAHRWKKPVLLLGLGLAVGLVALIWWAGRDEREFSGPNVYVVSETTQWSGDGFRIGVGNIAVADYADEHGVTRNGLTARFWLNVPRDQSQNQDLTVYVGRTFDFQLYRIEVLDIEHGLMGRGAVTIRVTSLKDIRRQDSDLLYASFYSSGLCGNSQGQSGGCYGQVYLYNSGRYLQETGWIGADNQENVSTEKELSSSEIKQVTDRITAAGIMTMDCPAEQLLDVSWSYQINFGGVKKYFAESPPENCRDVLKTIDDLVQSLGSDKID